MKKVLIVGGDLSVTNMFEKQGWGIAHTIWDADLIQFCGGHDVTPMIYGQKNTDSYYNLPRDIHEAGIFTIAKMTGKKMAGICRGGQFLNVIMGGTMVQHIDGHTQDHWLKMTGGYHKYQTKHDVTSTHHQQIVPTKEAILLASGPNGVAEIVGYYHPEDYPHGQFSVLCFQPHPEWGRHPELTDLYFNLINKELFGEV